jgi:lipopolysaccharide assembly protein A
MKTIKITLSIILLVLVLIFSLQNLGLMTVNLFNWSLSLPKALVIFLTYVLGMLTGGMFFTLLRSLVPAKDADTTPEK